MIRFGKPEWLVTIRSRSRDASYPWPVVVSELHPRLSRNLDNHRRLKLGAWERFTKFTHLLMEVLYNERGAVILISLFSRTSSDNQWSILHPGMPENL